MKTGPLKMLPSTTKPLDRLELELPLSVSRKSAPPLPSTTLFAMTRSRMKAGATGSVSICWTPLFQMRLAMMRVPPAA
jgi:hypothetical protein